MSSQSLSAAVPSGTSASDVFLSLVSDPFKTSIQGTAFTSALIISLTITAITALIFSFIRPYNSVVYAPRLRHSDQKHAPPVLSKTPWAWVDPVVKTKEELLVEKIGMDATVFIRFTNMLRNIFLLLTIVLCSVLVPVYIIGGKQFNQNVNTITKMTPQFLIGTNLWVIVAGAWLVNIVVCFFLWWNYKSVARLRQKYFASPDYTSSLHSRTIMVTNMPKPLATNEGVVRILNEIKQTASFPRATIGRNLKGLPDLIEEHDELVKNLESVLAKYLKNPDRLPAQRPTMKPSKKDKEYSSGEKVDSIKYLTKRIEKLEDEIKKVRKSIDTRDATGYGFASFDSIEEAHSVAYAARGKHPQGTKIFLAPRPAEIIWKNLYMSKKVRSGKRLMARVWIVLLTLLYIVPNAMIAVFLSDLGNLGLVWPAFNKSLNKHPKSWAIVQGVLAPTVTSLVYIYLPKIFRRLSESAGDVSKHSRDTHVLGRLYAFFVFNNLIVFSVFGSVWQWVAAIINAKQNDKNVLSAIVDGNTTSHLMIALCNVAPFWASYLTFRTVSAALDISQLANFALGWFQRTFMAPTPREVIEYSAPPPFDYASYYNYFLFYATVAIGFSSIQPIVLPVTALYFAIDAWLKKYLLLYVFTTKTESGGRMWRVLYNRMLFSLLLSDLVVALIMLANRESTGYAWIAMLGSLAPLPLLKIGFKLYCSKSFDGLCEYAARGVTKADIEDVPAIEDDNKSIRSTTTIALRFGHPALYRPLLVPMVHAKAQHLLFELYEGRLDYDEEEDPELESTYHGGSYRMQHLRSASKSRLNEMKQHEKKRFEFVKEADLDFENFKDRSDFRSNFGGDEELYGKGVGTMSRAATPINGLAFSDGSQRPPYSRAASSQPYNRSGTPVGGPEIPRYNSPLSRPVNTESRDSDRTFVDTGSHHYQHGVGSFTRNVSEERGISPHAGLLSHAAPLGREASERGAGGYFNARSITPMSRESTPGIRSDSDGERDYFRGRKQ